jgi:hypothetical protein
MYTSTGKWQNSPRVVVLTQSSKCHTNYLRQTAAMLGHAGALEAGRDRVCGAGRGIGIPGGYGWEAMDRRRNSGTRSVLCNTSGHCR